MEHFKKTTVCFNLKEANWSLTKKKEKLTESLHLTGGNDKKVEL